MEITLSSQVQIFLLACALGVLLSIFYDVFRVLRMVAQWQTLQIFFHDIIYFTVCGFFTFTFALATNCGNVRFYIVAGEIIGWCVYHLTIGEFMMRALMRVVNFLRGLLKKGKLKFVAPLRAMRGKLGKKA